MSSANEVINVVLFICVRLCVGRNVQFLCERHNVRRLDICQHNPSTFSVNLLQNILISICACEHDVYLN